MTEEAFDVTFDVNVKAPFLLTAAIAPRMAAKGGGSIINISTMAANIGMNGLAVYGASKATAHVNASGCIWTARNATNPPNPSPTTATRLGSHP